MKTLTGAALAEQSRDFFIPFFEIYLDPSGSNVNLKPYLINISELMQQIESNLNEFNLDTMRLVVDNWDNLFDESYASNILSGAVLYGKQVQLKLGFINSAGTVNFYLGKIANTPTCNDDTKTAEIVVSDIGIDLRDHKSDDMKTGGDWYKDIKSATNSPDETGIVNKMLTNVGAPLSDDQTKVIAPTIRDKGATVSLGTWNMPTIADDDVVIDIQYEDTLADTNLHGWYVLTKKCEVWYTQYNVYTSYPKLLWVRKTPAIPDRRGVKLLFFNLTVMILAGWTENTTFYGDEIPYWYKENIENESTYAYFIKWTRAEDNTTWAADSEVNITMAKDSFSYTNYKRYCLGNCHKYGTHIIFVVYESLFGLDNIKKGHIKLYKLDTSAMTFDANSPYLMTNNFVPTYETMNLCENKMTNVYKSVIYSDYLYVCISRGIQKSGSMENVFNELWRYNLADWNGETAILKLGNLNITGWKTANILDISMPGHTNDYLALITYLYKSTGQDWSSEDKKNLYYMAITTAGLENDLLMWIDFDEADLDNGYLYLKNSANKYLTASSTDWVRQTSLDFSYGLKFYKVDSSGVGANFNTQGTELASLSKNVSVSCWILLTNRTGFVQNFFHRAVNNGEDYIENVTLEKDENDKFTFGIRDAYNSDFASARAESTTTPTDNVWYFIVGTYDGNLGTENLKIFVNSIKENTTNFTNAIINGTTNQEDIRLGARYTFRAGETTIYGNLGVNTFYGILEDVMYWNKTLTQTEITNLYNQKKIVDVKYYDNQNITNLKQASTTMMTIENNKIFEYTDFNTVNNTNGLTTIHKDNEAILTMPNDPAGNNKCYGLFTHSKLGIQLFRYWDNEKYMNKIEYADVTNSNYWDVITKISQKEYFEMGINYNRLLFRPRGTQSASGITFSVANRNLLNISGLGYERDTFYYNIIIVNTGIEYVGYGKLLTTGNPGYWYGDTLDKCLGGFGVIDGKQLVYQIDNDFIVSRNEAEWLALQLYTELVSLRKIFTLEIKYYPQLELGDVGTVTYAKMNLSTQNFRIIQIKNDIDNYKTILQCLSI